VFVIHRLSYFPTEQQTCWWTKRKRGGGRREKREERKRTKEKEKRKNELRVWSSGKKEKRIEINIRNRKRWLANDNEAGTQRRCKNNSKQGQFLHKMNQRSKI
jgi:hypothetical protein